MDNISGKTIAITGAAPGHRLCHRQGLAGPRGRRWLNKRLGLDRVFLDFDRTARAGYEDRAQHALG